MNDFVDIIPSKDIAEWVEEITSLGKRIPETRADSKAEDFIMHTCEVHLLPNSNYSLVGSQTIHYRPSQEF